MGKEALKSAIEAAFDGDMLSVRVTPKASRNVVTVEDGQVRVYVTTVPEGGKATKDVVKLLAKSLGIAKSTLELVRGETSRDKVFRRG
ncbi:MAG: DUF167 domain-containing protein [Alphaproteobacteria bacterium]|uniref:UPF0235 protein SAMN04488117_107136 n=1 Tax=Celeribacter baekdonensis TaxID=875171 RepID=A0A1G7NXE2_9RHOB|nr:DUF167 domain-containing protein [Celeribacter baekdonensis]MBU0644227.1 DUF167 domain-containing protein [Alphaproteobacteria bacterium]MBU1279822.1 DUF167 domain-containing protein [Alphaproteobacteria bacterium]MBU1574707.1 DUF167 domain-containing protein [Alphaproteobacteria bacterium]MBU1829896.1 DUF167 domain-containing protein [Alphaproteobacteria bacterium]MBU2079338.1 DUF167 domain-containing protein [Alphaproteobacteria bacterium]